VLSTPACQISNLTFSVPTAEVHAYVRAALPPPPARILEVGAGSGELAEALRGAGYDVLAIDPAGGDGVVQIPLREVEGTFDAAVAIVSMHHVEPLAESIDRLAAVLPPGARFVVDEFDVGAYDERAARWWLGHTDHHHEPGDLVADLRGHLHNVETIVAALRRWFDVGEPVRGTYLHRWEIGPALRSDEEEAVAAGLIPATGARFIATRASRAPSGPPPPPA
jgi:SAM-dependent methyltransferase